MRPCARRTVAVPTVCTTSGGPGPGAPFRLPSGPRERPEIGRQAVQVEGPERMEARMVRAVEVGRAGRQQPPLCARPRGDQRLLARMRDVEGLDAVEPE